MVQSMTAYAREEIKGHWGSALWELRSVNHRYLDISVKFPEQFRSLEMTIRERLRLALNRGKVDCSLTINFNQQNNTQLHLNEVLAKQLLDAAKLLQQDHGTGIVNLIDILRWPGVMQAPEQDLDSITHQVLNGFSEVLASFIAVRKGEGAQLRDLLLQRLVAIQYEITAVQQQMPAVLVWQRERLTTRLQEAELALDETRIEQELLLLAQKIDVAEELDRLQMHTKETQAILGRAEAIGRRLDFMMQEFNRETNTLGSKSINTDITNHVVQLKVLIEQMREQIQNIE